MYELHNLGWNSFQQLCLTIVREVLGQTVQSFLDSGDGGRDGAFTGTWQRNEQEDLAGRFVIQCKFTMIVVVWGRRPCRFGADRNRRGVGHIRQIGPCLPTLQNAGLRQRP